MTHETFRLADEHLIHAKEIAGRHCRKSGCKVCHGRGWQGVAQDNTIVLCHKCVDAEAAFTDWKDYVAGIPELRSQYHELFEEQKPVDEAAPTAEDEASRKPAEDPA